MFSSSSSFFERNAKYLCFLILDTWRLLSFVTLCATIMLG